MQNAFEFFLKKIKNTPFPTEAHIELTTKCNLACLYCYCVEKNSQLDTYQFKEILNQLKDLNVLWISFSGGEPLMRDDFLELYFYAKKKGFLISILTNGLLFNKKILNYLEKFVPYVVEITLNAIEPKIYQTITQKNVDVKKVLQNIKELKKRNIPTRVKSMILTLNKDQIPKIKKFVDATLGKPKNGYLFGYDFYIYPKINKDKSPLKYRLEFSEVEEVLKKDKDLYNDWLLEFKKAPPKIKKNVFPCNFFKETYVISAQGHLKFCIFSEKFSSDLTKKPLLYAYKELLKKAKKFFSQKFCYNKCNLRYTCFWCPIRAELEIDNKSKCIPYFYRWALALDKQTKLWRT